MSDHVYWWLQYLRIFALNTPFGVRAKFTIGVTAYDGEQLARDWKMTPKDVVDAHSRPCKQIETEDRLIAIEWLVRDESPPPSKNPVTWGGQTASRNE